jgi:HD superfamily phosphohydrolase
MDSDSVPTRRLSTQTGEHGGPAKALETAGLLVARTDEYVDPVWRTRTVLLPAEQAILATPIVRRLHFISHAGASRLVTAQTYSRLEHTMGVFSLVCHFHPSDAVLRAASLLHDVGHLPFSHSLEGLKGLDHHALGEACVAGIGDVLERHGLDVGELLDVLAGRTRSSLLGEPNFMNLDHLDSFVRSARAVGHLRSDGSHLLQGLSVRGNVVEAEDVQVARLLMGLVMEEARRHTSWCNVGPNWALRALAELVLEKIDRQDFARLTDDQLWATMSTSPATAKSADRIRLNADELIVTPMHAADSRVNYRIRKLYLSEPLVAGEVLSRELPDLKRDLDELQDELPRHFRVQWS